MCSAPLKDSVIDETLETGLRGVKVGYCVTSYVDPNLGLFYLGKPLKELAFFEPERVIFLLYYGRDGAKDEVEKFAKDLQKRAHINSNVITQIRLLPQKGDPMKHLACALLFSALFEKTGNYREDGLNLIAKIPEITAHVINHNAGWKFTPPSRPELGYMANFAQMLQVPTRSKDLEKVLKLFNILHYDHGGGNLSVFVAKAIASGLEDMYGSIAGGILALEGSRHGGANQECLHFVEEMMKKLGDQANASDVEQYIRNKLANNELIYGFGHAVLRVEDPRATILYKMGEENFLNDPLVKLALLIRTQGTKVLKENPKIACPYPNVDAISGIILSAAGFPYPQYFPLLFGMARVVGMAIQIIYERLEARQGKGTPIMRPKYPFKPR